MTDPYQNYPQGGPQYGPPGTGPGAPGQYPSQPQPGYSSQPQPGYPSGPYGQAQPMGYNPADPEAPYGRDWNGVPFSDKQKLVAGLLQIFLGAFGAGRFYTGHSGMAIGQIAATWLTCGLGGIWPLIDGIMMLTGKVPDSYGRPLRD